jgi:hypothetical protein
VIRSTHKRGDTFVATGPITATVGGVPVANFTGWTGASQLRDATTDELIATLEFTWLNAATGQARLRFADTSAWPITLANMDIQLTTPAGETVSTATTAISITKDVTRP